MLEAWVDTLKKDSDVYAAASPEALESMLNQDPDLLGRLDCIVTDLNFDNSEQSGIDLGRMIKHRRPSLRVLLSSDGVVSVDQMAGAIDGVVAKDPVTYIHL